MVFSSITFLCIFLPIVFLLHCILPDIRARNGMLLAASLLFYAYGEPVYVLLMVFSAYFHYLCAVMIDRYSSGKRWIVAVAVTESILMLLVFKYTGFLADLANHLPGVNVPVPSIRLPLGISFFTFQSMSYVIDVYRGTAKAQKSFGKVLLYISFFPQLIAGPIIKYHDIEKEINERYVTIDRVASGIRRFIAGLSKKVLISNTMGIVADTLFAADKGSINAVVAWIGAISYLYQIYYDFSGYSDMAIGMGEMFGFHFRENFNYPYVSGSIREFWRRWHISLSDWFLEYLYIPLGGNRKGRRRTVLNKFIVFLCTGIWHGANLTFIFWGIYHGFFLMLEEYVPFISRKGGPIKTVLQHIYTLFIVCMGFVFFRSDTLRDAIFWIKEMFTGFRFGRAGMSLALQQLTPVYLLTLTIAVISCFPIIQRIKSRRYYEPASCVLSLASFALCMLSLASGTYNPFIYFRF